MPDSSDNGSNQTTNPNGTASVSTPVPQNTVPIVNTQVITPTGKETTTNLKKGSVFYKGDIKFRITSLVRGKYEVSVIGVKNRRVKKITIPNTVYIEPYQFAITSLGKNFISGCKKLTKISIKAKHITKADKKAFTGKSKKCKISVLKSKVKLYRKLFKL